MKKIYFSLAIVIATCLTINAQTQISIAETTHVMSKGTKNAFIVKVPQYKAADVRREWENYLKDNGKVEIKENNGEISAQNVKIEKVFMGNINHYALFDETIDGPKLVTFYAINDTFISSVNNSVVAGAIGKFMMDFAKGAYTKAVQKELAMEKDKLESLNDELSDMEKNENACRQNIVEANNKIEKYNNSIVINKADQVNKQKELELQQEKMSKVVMNNDERKLQDKQINSLKNNKKDLVKNEGKMRKDIEDLNNTINVEQNKIPALQSQEETQKVKIQKQQDVIQLVQVKLDGINKM
jgi:hypothetical protein